MPLLFFTPYSLATYLRLDGLYVHYNVAQFQLALQFIVECCIEKSIKIGIHVCQNYHINNVLMVHGVELIMVKHESQRTPC